jgi:hypothetical protein
VNEAARRAAGCIASSTVSSRFTGGRCVCAETVGAPEATAWKCGVGSGGAPAATRPHDDNTVGPGATGTNGGWNNGGVGLRRHGGATEVAGGRVCAVGVDVVMGSSDSTGAKQLAGVRPQPLVSMLQPKACGQTFTRRLHTPGQASLLLTLPHQRP